MEPLSDTILCYNQAIFFFFVLLKLEETKFKIYMRKFVHRMSYSAPLVIRRGLMIRFVNKIDDAP